MSARSDAIVQKHAADAYMRARTITRLRARCMVAVATSDRMIFETRGLLKSLHVKRPA